MKRKKVFKWLKEVEEDAWKRGHALGMRIGRQQAESDCKIKSVNNACGCGGETGG